MKFKPYPSYKDSGIEWLGDVPDHWKVKRIKYIGDAIIGLTYSPNDVVDSEGTIVLRSSNLKNDRINLSDKVYVNSTIPKKLVLKAGDILICSRNGSRNLIGKNALITEKEAGLTFGAFTTILRSDCFQFLYFILNSSLFDYQAGMFLTTTINQLTTGTLNNFEIPFPTRLEQTAIANFLDRETLRIDALVEEKNHFIGLLKEKRQALISHVVTKGLDPIVKMKDSGVDWLGEVPEHWAIEKIKYLASLRSGDFITSESIDEDGDYPVFGGNGIRGYTTSFTHDGRYILIGRQGALCGNINYSEGQFWASEHAVVVFPRKDFSITWLGELLGSMNLNQYSVSSAQPGLSVDRIVNLKIPSPPFQEQTAIANFLDNQTTKIDALITETQQSIALLKEHRTALISAAVTGKIDVREVA